MKDKSGHTIKTTDWLGREKEEHYDNSGNKIGETKFTSDWLGNSKQEHFNSEGNKTGETRKGSDWLGSDRAEHYDNEGKKVGYSKNETDWLGTPIQRHYNPSGENIGSSRGEEDWIGNHRKEHHGKYFKGDGNNVSIERTYPKGFSCPTGGIGSNKLRQKSFINMMPWIITFVFWLPVSIFVLFPMFGMLFTDMPLNGKIVMFMISPLMGVVSGIFGILGIIFGADSVGMPRGVSPETVAFWGIIFPCIIWGLIKIAITTRK